MDNKQQSTIQVHLPVKNPQDNQNIIDQCDYKNIPFNIFELIISYSDEKTKRNFAKTNKRINTICIELRSKMAAPIEKIPWVIHQLIMVNLDNISKKNLGLTSVTNYYRYSKPTIDKNKLWTKKDVKEFMYKTSWKSYIKFKKNTIKDFVYMYEFIIDEGIFEENIKIITEKYPNAKFTVHIRGEITIDLFPKLKVFGERLTTIRLSEIKNATLKKSKPITLKKGQLPDCVKHLILDSTNHHSTIRSILTSIKFRPHKMIESKDKIKINFL